ncbi:MAG: hypothetical protein CMP23_02345 [Rickettsiales bacterium]|nr:hypothetical protein [Rickettsiales bacterium]
MEHHAHSSSLTRRRPSRKEDEARLTAIHNSYAAARLRRVIGAEQSSQLHEPVTFSWQQFWVTLLYEMLPQVICAPAAVLLIEPSLREAWHVLQHRALLAVSTRYRPRSSILLFWLMFYPLNLLIHLALLVTFLAPSELSTLIDPFQVLLAYGFMVVRNIIVAVKYGYLRPEDVARLRCPPPDWDEDRSDRRLIFGGWRAPGSFPGLIEDELTCAMDENDIALQGMSFDMDPTTSALLRDHQTSELFTATTPSNGEQQVSAGFIAHQLTHRAYSVPFPKRYMRITMTMPFVLAGLPPLARWHYGLGAFGETGIETFVSIVVFLVCLFSSVPVFVFGLISAHDFNRRTRLIDSLCRLVRYPGLPLSRLLGLNAGPAAQQGKETHVFIDLERASNVFAWINCRKTLRSFGEGYYQRTQVYTSILLGYAFLCILLLNVIMWGQLPHHIGTIYLISAIVVTIASISMASITKATRLQGLSRQHRDLIKAQVFLQEKALLELTEESDAERIRELRHSKSLLREVDEMIHFQEEIYKPTRVLGQAATQNVMNSTLGVLIAGLIFAIEGSGGANIVYDAFGWFLR